MTETWTPSQLRWDEGEEGGRRRKKKRSRKRRRRRKKEDFSLYPTFTQSYTSTWASWQWFIKVPHLHFHSSFRDLNLRCSTDETVKILYLRVGCCLSLSTSLFPWPALCSTAVSEGKFFWIYVLWWERENIWEHMRTVWDSMRVCLFVRGLLILHFVAGNCRQKDTLIPIKTGLVFFWVW